MLSEAFKYLTTPCRLHLKSMGYLRELIALEARFMRCHDAWRPHLQKTKSIICDAANTVQRKNKVIVLGCGILSDIPISYLSEEFETVKLIDVCFLRHTQKTLRHFNNIEWHAADITGVAEHIYNEAKGKRPIDKLHLPAGPLDFDLQEADLVISANILSQLPLIPLEFLRKTMPLMGDQASRDFAQDIIRSHLDLLGTCTGAVCLISETERQICDGERLLDTEDPLWGYSTEIDGQEWIWDVAPRSEISPDYDVRNRVIGAHWQNDPQR